MKELNMYSTDAMHWAECLESRLKSGIAPDADFLVGWFANYWAAVHDPLKAALESENAALKARAEHAESKVTMYATGQCVCPANGDPERNHYPGCPHVAALENAALRALLSRFTLCEKEPFGYFKPEPFGWTDCAETADGVRPLYAPADIGKEGVE